MVTYGIQFGRISGYFQYPVSSRISGKSSLVSGRIPDMKKGLIIWPDILCMHPY
jgi:hypothetical protein